MRWNSMKKALITAGRSCIRMHMTYVLKRSYHIIFSDILVYRNFLPSTCRNQQSMKELLTLHTAYSQLEHQPTKRMMYSLGSESVQCYNWSVSPLLSLTNPKIHSGLTRPFPPVTLIPDKCLVTIPHSIRGWTTSSSKRSEQRKQHL